MKYPSQQERQQFVMEYIRRNGPVDKYSRAFMASYTDRFPMCPAEYRYGSLYSDSAMDDMESMHDTGSLMRTQVGVDGDTYYMYYLDCD